MKMFDNPAAVETLLPCLPALRHLGDLAGARPCIVVDTREQTFLLFVNPCRDDFVHLLLVGRNHFEWVRTACNLDDAFPLENAHDVSVNLAAGFVPLP